MPGVVPEQLTLLLREAVAAAATPGTVDPAVKNPTEFCDTSSDM